jgi:hypothetical protein
MYGLSKTKIIDSEQFWQEVSLRAENNYGDWEMKYPIAFRWVNRAILDIVTDCGWNGKYYNALIAKNNLTMQRIAKDMVRLD